MGNYGPTWNATLLISVPDGVITWTLPVVAPAGTEVVMALAVELTVNTAGAPLNVTLVVPYRFVPKIVTAVPNVPVVGRVLTNGPSPTDTLKTVPHSEQDSFGMPPALVVP